MTEEIKQVEEVVAESTEEVVEETSVAEEAAVEAPAKEKSRNTRSKNGIRMERTSSSNPSCNKGCKRW